MIVQPSSIPFFYNHSLFAVPLATLQSLQAGQGIPTGTPGHLLVKTETGQYQILRVGPPGATPAAAATQQQQPAAGVRPAATPPAAAAAAAPAIRLPTQPVAVSRPPQQQPPSTSAAAPAAAASPAVSAAAAAGAGGVGGMGQQMTPDTAKVNIVAISELHSIRRPAIQHSGFISLHYYKQTG